MEIFLCALGTLINGDCETRILMKTAGV